MNIDKDLIYTFVGIVLGIFIFISGLRLFYKKRFIENIPTSTVRGLAMGLVELKGRASRARTFKSPLTETECTFYRYTVERYKSSGRSGYWVKIAEGSSALCPFAVADETGEILVLPKGAELFMPAAYTLTTDLTERLPDELVNFLAKNNIQYKGLFFNYTLRFQEWHIKPDETVFIVGTAQPNETQLDEHRETLSKHLASLNETVQQGKNPSLAMHCERGPGLWQLVSAHAEHQLLHKELQAEPNNKIYEIIISKGESDQIFIVSDQSPSQVVKDLSWKATLCILGGSALSIALLAHVLSRFGVVIHF